MLPGTDPHPPLWSTFRPEIHRQLIELWIDLLQRQIPILQDLLATGSGKADVPFQVAQDYYAAVDGTTLTAITIEAPREAAHGSGDVALRAFARLEPAGDGKPANLTGDLPFIPAPPAEAPRSADQAELLRAFAGGATEESAEVAVVRRVDPDRAYVEVERRFTVRGTSAWRSQTVYLGMRLEGSSYRVVEIRVVPQATLH